MGIRNQQLEEDRMSSPIVELRRLIQENTRIQKGLAIEIDYVDVSHALADGLVARLVR